MTQEAVKDSDAVIVPPLTVDEILDAYRQAENESLTHPIDSRGEPVTTNDLENLPDD